MNIPIGLLERSIKLTNEPPQGLQANLRRSFALFNREEFDERDSKIKRGFPRKLFAFRGLLSSPPYQGPYSLPFATSTH